MKLVHEITEQLVARCAAHGIALALLIASADAQVIGGKTPNGMPSAGTTPAGTPACGVLANHNIVPNQPGGVGYDGTHVWVGAFNDAPLLWKIDAATGALVGTLPAPGLHVGGIACANGTLWVALEQAGMIYQLNPADGSVLHSIPSPTITDLDPNGGGLAWDGLALWQVDYRRNLIYKLSPTNGQVLWSVSLALTGPGGLSYVDGQLLVSSFSTRGIYQVDVSNGSINSICLAAGQFPWGLAVDAAGSTWISDGNTGRLRLTPTGYEVSRYCFGDGSSSACPCGNPGPIGAGCQNSTGLGASLNSSGAPSVTNDSLSFSAVGLVPGQPALLFAGAHDVNAGQGAQFGDGLRCAGGSVVRLGVLNADGSGLAAWGPGSLQASWLAGETRYFQVRYRDLSGPCGSGFNLSNGSAHLLVL